MEIQDGFIVGIFNYCDRWCEACAFTSRCRSFAMQVELEARMDPSLRDVVGESRPDERLRPPSWWQALIGNAGVAPAHALSRRAGHRAVPADHAEIERRAEAYARAVETWLKRQPLRPRSSLMDPVSVVSWYAFFIASKITRTIRGLADEDWPAPDRADQDGSAKVALLAIERSHLAWLELTRRGVVPAVDAEPFLLALVWIGGELDRMFPNARAFVRPGFDEPEAAAMLQED
jgi:hypothetical protein